MERPISNTSLLRQTLIAVGFALGGSALFVGLCLGITSTVLDRALPSQSKGADESAELAAGDGANPTNPLSPRS